MRAGDSVLYGERDVVTLSDKCARHHLVGRFCCFRQHEITRLIVRKLCVCVCGCVLGRLLVKQHTHTHTKNANRGNNCCLCVFAVSGIRVARESFTQSLQHGVQTGVLAYLHETSDVCILCAHIIIYIFRCRLLTLALLSKHDCCCCLCRRRVSRDHHA